MMRKRLRPSIVARDHARLCLPLPADRLLVILFLQRVAAGHGLGRLVDALVRRAAGDAPILEAAFISLEIALRLGDRRDRSSARSRRSRWCASAASAAALLFARDDLCAAGDARSHHRPVAAAAVRRRSRAAAASGPSSSPTPRMAMCFVAVIVQARLVDFDRASRKRRIDLGALAAGAPSSVTLPLIAAGLGRGLDARLHALARRPGDRELHHRPGRDHAADPHLFGGSPRVNPEMNAVCSIMVGVVGRAVIAASLLTKLGAARGATTRA